MNHVLLLGKNGVEFYYKLERMEIRCFLLNLKCIIDEMDKSIWIILLYALTNNGCNFNSIRSYYINTEKSFVIFINPCKIILFINIKNGFYILRCFSIEIVVSSCKLKETFIILLKMKVYSILVLEFFQRSE